MVAEIRGVSARRFDFVMAAALQGAVTVAVVAEAEAEAEMAAEAEAECSLP
jgi:adenylate kinase